MALINKKKNLKPEHQSLSKVNLYSASMHTYDSYTSMDIYCVISILVTIVCYILVNRKGWCKEWGSIFLICTHSLSETQSRNTRNVSCRGQVDYEISLKIGIFKYLCSVTPNEHTSDMVEDWTQGILMINLNFLRWVQVSSAMWMIN